MTDRPTNDLPPQQEDAGGWRVNSAAGQLSGETENAVTPPVDETEAAAQMSASQVNAPAEATASAWRSPGKQTGTVNITPAAAPKQAWRIPTIPRDLQPAPSESGGWHRPAQTLVGEDDESVVLSDEAPSVEAVPVESTEFAVLPHDNEEFASEDILPIDGQAVDEVEVLPFEGEAEEEAEDEETADDEEEADDEDRFSMSQLVALASLAENTPGVAVETGEPEASDMDAAAYAREQIEKLRGVGAADDLEDELEEAAVEEASHLTPEEQAEAAKFHAAEARIRALREQYSTGQLTHDELNAALKKEMVLDASNTWWMMGTETDTWYHHVGSGWVKEVPPILEKERGVSGADIQAASELNLTVPTQALDLDMPLPLAVPTRDLDATMVGTEGLYLDPALQATMPAPAIGGDYTVMSGATVPAAAFAGGDYVAPAMIPAPYVPAQTDVPNYAEAVQRQQSSTLRTVAIIAAVGLGIILLLGACGAILMATTFNRIVSPYETQIAGLANYQPAFQTARIYAADGGLIATLIGQGDRQPVTLSDVSPFFTHAVLSVEDPDFYETAGFSALNVAGGFLQNTFGGGVNGTRGITEQIACALVIRDCSNTPDNNLTIFAVSADIARTYDANFILQLYINEVFLGNESYGAQSGAEFYFQIPALNMNAAQSALLAGLIDGPATYDPVVNRQASFDRMNEVLNIQASVGCIQFQFAPYLNAPFCVTPEYIVSGEVVLEKAQVEAANYYPRTNDDLYPHFVNYVMAQIEQVYGSSELYSRGFQIYTTLVPNVQNAAQAALVAGISGVASQGVNNGAVLVADPITGAIRAMVGSPNFDDTSIQGEVNNVFTWQPPGDAIFPVTYTSALEGITNGQGVFQYMTAASILWNVPTTFNTNPPFTPTNVNNIYTGPTAVRYALGNSYNVTGAKAYEFIGDQNFVNVSNRMGINYLSDAAFGLPASLGTNSVRLYDMVEAYGTLANNGNRVPLNAIIRITDSAGADVPYAPLTGPSQQVQPQTAFIISNILADDGARTVTYGPNSGLNLANYPGSVASKAGTSATNADFWTVGYSSTQVVGVWTGSTNNGTTSANVMQAAVPVWNSVMQTALSGTSPRFSQPSGIVQAQICTLTGALYDPSVSQNCGSVRTELFAQNAPPLPPSDGFVTTVTIDTWSGQAANQYCPDNTTTGQYINVTDPSAAAWLQSSQGQIFLQQNGITNIAGYQIPAPCSINTQNPILSITSPTTGQTVLGTINITGTVQAVGLSQFTIDIAPQSQPTSFSVVSGPSTVPVQNGTLGTLDTTRVVNGAYILRLAAYNTANGYAYRTVQININNPAPTATATPPILPTEFPTFPPQILPTVPVIGFPTPIPFDLPTPTISFGS